MLQLLFVGRRVRATKTYDDELGLCLSRLTWLREHPGGLAKIGFCGQCQSPRKYANFSVRAVGDWGGEGFIATSCGAQRVLQVIR